MLTLLRHRRKSFRVVGDSYTLEESFADDSANEYEWSKGASTTYVATLVAPASSYTATRLEFYLKKTGTGGGTITAEIWSATGSSGSETPDALLATSTTTVAASGVSAIEDWVSFDFAGQAIASGTKYFFVMKTPTTGDVSNYYDLTLGSSYNTTNFETVRGDATPTWAVANGGRGGYCRAYSGGSASSGGIPTPELLHWPLNDAAGTTIAALVGAGATSINGTLNGDYFYLDSTEDRFTSSSDIAYGTNIVTVSFWFQTDNNNMYGEVFRSREVSNNDMFAFSNQGGWQELHIKDASGNVLNKRIYNVLTANTWYHFVMVFDGPANSGAGDAKYYINKVEQTLVTNTNNKNGTSNFATAAFSLGGTYSDTPDFLMDDLRIYSGELTTSQIDAIYDAGRPTSVGLTPTLVNSIGATSNGKQSRTIDISSATEGAVMFLCWTHRSISSTNTPSGWTFLCHQDNGSHSWRPDTNVYYKTAGASESTVTLSCSNYEYMTAGVIEIVGADTSTLSFATRLGNVIPSVTQSAGGLVFAVHGTAAGSTNTNDTTWTNSAYTELFDEWGNRSGTAVAWADFGAGATNGTDTATGWGGTDGAGNCCIHVAVDAV